MKKTKVLNLMLSFLFIMVAFMDRGYAQIAVPVTPPAATAKTSPATNSTDAARANDQADQDEEDAADMLAANKMDRGENFADVSVPIASFIFVLILVLGARYMREQTARQKMSILKLMVEKGQPISDSIVKEMMTTDSRRNFDPLSARNKQLRNGFAFTGVGIALCIYRFLAEGGHHEKAFAIGLVFLGLGIGLLLFYKLSEKNTQA